MENIIVVPKAASVQLSKNFNSTIDKFDCQCNSVHCVSTLIYRPTLDFIQKMREYLGFPMTLSCAYRCSVHNKIVGGGEYSQHLIGFAVDIRPVSGFSATENISKIYKYSMGNLPHTGGIGKYNSFVHIDLRTKKARW